jgi:hypothetical protein
MLKLISAVLVGMLGIVATPRPARAQALPSPLELVSGLDLECFATPGPALNKAIDLTQLNPALIGQIPRQTVTIGELIQTCVPVRKNNAAPPAAARPFIRQIDLACYKIDAPLLAVQPRIKLTNLNPELTLPIHYDTLTRAVQLCLPVAKNNQPPDGAVLALARHVDLECFATDPDPSSGFDVDLTQLNPQLVTIPRHHMTLAERPRHLCVPVQKGDENIPTAIASLVQWIDLEKYHADPVVTIAPVMVELQHLNAMFEGEQHVMVKLEQATALMVPVAKNDRIPPIE